MPRYTLTSRGVGVALETVGASRAQGKRGDGNGRGGGVSRTESRLRIGSSPVCLSSPGLLAWARGTRAAVSEKRGVVSAPEGQRRGEKESVGSLDRECTGCGAESQVVTPRLSLSPLVDGVGLDPDALEAA